MKVRIFRATGQDAIDHLEEQINAWIGGTLGDEDEIKRTDATLG
jgi:aromatic ring-cleaving dioxygenase